MSGILLREVVRDMLINHLLLGDRRQIRVMDHANSATPEPFPVFVGVSPGRWKQWAGWKYGPTLDEEFGVTITVSAKAGAIQPQLYGELILQRKWPITSCGVGVEALCREIVTYLHNNSDVTCQLNQKVDPTPQFSGGLYFGDGGQPMDKTGAWWGDIGQNNKTVIGMAQTISFYGLRRTQDSETAE